MKWLKPLAAAAATMLFCFLFVVLVEGILFGGGDDGTDHSILLQISLAILALCGVVAACTTLIVDEIRHSKDKNTEPIQKIQKRD